MSFKQAVNLEALKEQHHNLGAVIEGIDEYGHCSGHSDEYKKVEDKAKEALERSRRALRN